MKTVFYVGKPYPHASGIQELKQAGYAVGLFQDRSQKIKNIGIFDHILQLDFETEDRFIKSLKNSTNLPKIDGLLCSHENYVVYKSLAADILGIPALGIESARAATDKYEMRKRFAAHDESITPRFTLVTSEEQMLEFAATAQYPLIMKPTNLVKSLLITKCDTKKDLIRAYQTTLTHIDGVYKQQNVTNREPGIIVEEFITGSMCSIAAFTDALGNIYLCDGIVELVTAQAIGFDDNFLYSRSITNCIDPHIRDLIRSVAIKGIEALSLRSTAAHVEIIFDEHNARLVEIGARIGGYRPFLYEKSYGIHLLEQEAIIATGGMPDLSGKFTRYSAMLELFPRKSGYFRYLEGVKQSSDYEYFHQVAQTGKKIGFAKDGHKAAAIIGVADTIRPSFDARVADVGFIQVVTE